MAVATISAIDPTATELGPATRRCDCSTRRSAEGVRLARFWFYLGCDDAAYNVFDFHESRSRDGPREFLETFRG